MKRALLVILVLLPIVMDALSVTASVNKTTIELNDRLEYTIRTKSENKIEVSEPQAPKLELFSFVNMTSSSRSSSSIINFKVQKEYERSFTYIYVPLKQGSISIPAQSIKVDNKVYNTQAIDVDVVKASGSSSKRSIPPQGFTDIFDEGFPWASHRNTGNTMLLALPQRQPVYKGEPVIVSYYLYTDQMVRSFNLDDERDFPGYGKSIYEQPNSLDYESVTHQGKRFQRALIKKLVLLPNQIGELRAPELQGSARIYEFGYMNYPLRSNDAWLEVKPLPTAEVPKGYTGAVGRFSVSEDISSKEISLGEAVTFSLRIAGKGNFNQFGNPQFPQSEAQTSSPLAIDKLNAGIEGSRVLYYTIIPSEKGVYNLPSVSFSWFDPQSGAYNVYRSKSQAIKVKSANVISYFSGLLDSGKPQTLRPMLSRSVYKQYPNYLKQIWYWLLVAIILIGTAVALYFCLHRIKRLRDPESYAKLMADKVLKKYLTEAENAAKEGSDLFYSLSENGLIRYISDKYNIAMGLSTAQKMLMLSKLNIPQDLIDDTSRFVDICESHRFSGAQTDVTAIIHDLEKLKSLVARFSRLGARR